MNIKKILHLASLLCILALVVGCTQTASEKLEGRWVLDVKKTRDYTPLNEDEDSIVERSKDMVERGMQNIFEGTELTFNTKDKTVSGKLFGISISNKQYGIVEDSAEQCTILVLTETLIITPEEKTLTLQKSNGDVFYFDKVQ